MRSMAFLTQKGGTGKTTLAASIAVVAAEKGEKVVVLDLDPQASLVHWGERRQAANTRCQVIDNYGEVIPGLYAVGEVTGGLVGKGTYLGGLMWPASMTFGRLVGRSAAFETE